MIGKQNTFVESTDVNSSFYFLNYSLIDVFTILIIQLIIVSALALLEKKRFYLDYHLNLNYTQRRLLVKVSDINLVILSTRKWWCPWTWEGQGGFCTDVVPWILNS